MTHLKEGDQAPLFTATDQHGNEISLKELRGKKIILYFYPEDDTPTCTVQACNLRDNETRLKQHGFTILGVSPNNEKSHLAFQKKYALPFSLLTDPTHKIINQYSVWGEKQLYGRRYMGLHRTTFIIDEQGMIRKIFLKPKNKMHAEEILSEQGLKGWEE